nr:cytochrome c [uncultured Pedobacter sp.]
MRKLLIPLVFLGLVSAIFLNACNQESIKYQGYYTSGSALYKTHCGNCHMDDGKGLEGLIPPLTDSVFLKSNREKLACFIINGLTDTIVVNGKTFDGVMPAEKHLVPLEIAKVLTYITNTFGNKQGIYDVAEVEKNLKTCE